jgi:hypothetical protein
LENTIEVLNRRIIVGRSLACALTLVLAFAAGCGKKETAQEQAATPALASITIAVASPSA